MSIIDPYHNIPNFPKGEVRACFCTGPRNGDPVCPCRMAEYNRRKLADLALTALAFRKKLRIRVKAGRREVAV